MTLYVALLSGLTIVLIAGVIERLVNWEVKRKHRILHPKEDDNK